MKQLVATMRARHLRASVHGTSGFTLIELMVVIVIIGLLATVVVVNVLPSQDKARYEKAKADIALIEQGLDLYKLDHLSYPTTEQGLAVLVNPPANAQTGARTQSYIKRLPNDPWGAAYQYTNPGRDGRAYDLYSFGPSGKASPDGKGQIGNWNISG